MSAEDRPGDESSSDSTTIHLRRTYDWLATAPSIAAIEALAHLENVDPTELTTIFEATLHDYVDPEALDTLVRDGKLGSATVTVTIDRYQLLFEGNELVVFEVSGPSSE
ncbi:HalOD1 output domain-containing protein [Saliphagus sp. GCM10025308]